MDRVVVRDVITRAKRDHQAIADDYLYIRIAQFQTNTGRDFNDRLRENLKPTPRPRA